MGQSPLTSEDGADALKMHGHGHGDDDGTGGKGAGSMQQTSDSLKSRQPSSQLRLSNDQLRREDIRIADAWNECFKDKANLKDSALFDRFWVEVKERLIRKYTTVHGAFKSLSSDALSFLEFNALLQTIQLQLDPRISRAVFDKATCGDRTLNVEYFKALLMAQTVKKLQFVMETFSVNQARIQAHTRHFLLRLATANEATMLRAVDRFQDKITVDVCRELWSVMRSSRDFGQALDQGTFTKFIQHDFPAKFPTFGIFDMQCMVRVLQRIQERRSGPTRIVDFITTLILASSDASRLSKLGLIFDMFDSDFDGCLLYEEIKAILRCMCLQRLVFEEVGMLSAHDSLSLQEELGIQEGLHMYEGTRWRLQRGSQVEEIVTLRELWEALETQANTLQTLIPSAVQLRWLVPKNRESDGRAGQLPPAPPQVQAHQIIHSVGEAKQPLVPLALAVKPHLSRRGDGYQTASSFGRARTNQFHKSVRNLSERRLAELVNGFRVDRAEIVDVNEGEASQSTSPGGILSRIQSAPELPSIHTQKWGGHAADRFRVYEAAISGRGGRRHKNAGNKGCGYHCQLCQRYHMLVADCKQ